MPPVPATLGAYEASLADVQRLYKRLRDARGPMRRAAARDYERALARARELGARVATDMGA